MANQEKTIIRQHRRHYFVQVPNETARDPSLSWKATGLLCFLLSLPDNWELNLAHLSKVKKDGRDATRAGMKELENEGYLFKDVLRDAAGRIEGTQWIVSDFPFSENPKTASPTSEKPTQQISIGRNTELTNTTTDLKENNLKMLKDLLTKEGREKRKQHPEDWAEGAIRKIKKRGLSEAEQKKIDTEKKGREKSVKAEAGAERFRDFIPDPETARKGRALYGINNKAV